LIQKPACEVPVALVVKVEKAVAAVAVGAEVDKVNE
jgi:hypothetical protein